MWLLTEIGAVLDPTYRRFCDHSITAACASLSLGALAQAWAAGQALSLEQAVAYALEEAEGIVEDPRSAYQSLLLLSAFLYMSRRPGGYS